MNFMPGITLRITKRIGKFIRSRVLGLFSYYPITISDEQYYEDRHPEDKYVRLSHCDFSKTNYLVYPMHYKHPSRIVRHFVDEVIPTIGTFYCLKKIWGACLFAYNNFLYTELSFCTFSWYLLYEVEYVPFDFNVDDVDIWVRIQPLDFSEDGLDFTSIPMSSNLDQKPSSASVSPTPSELTRENRPTLKQPALATYVITFLFFFLYLGGRKQ